MLHGSHLRALRRAGKGVRVLVRLDERRDQPGLEVDHSFTSLGNSLQKTRTPVDERITQKSKNLVIKNVSTHQDQVLNEIGQASVGQDDQSSYWAGNSLGVTVTSRMHSNSSIGGIGTFVTVLGAAASRNQLKWVGEVIIKLPST